MTKMSMFGQRSLSCLNNLFILSLRWVLSGSLLGSQLGIPKHIFIILAPRSINNSPVVHMQLPLLFWYLSFA